MKKAMFFNTGALAVMSAASIAAADGSATKIRVGFQGTYARLTGEMSSYAPDGQLYSNNAPSGLGGAAFLEFALSDKTGVRARIEHLSFGESKSTDLIFWLGGIGGTKHERGYWAKPTITSLAGDWIYRHKSHDSGFFFTAGGGLINSKMDIKEFLAEDGDIVGTVNWNTKSSISVGLLAGLGYNFNKNIGIEAKFTRTFGSSVEEPQTVISGDIAERKLVDRNIDWSWINLSISYRF